MVEKELVRLVQFTIATKKFKYLVMKITKYEKVLYNENYRALRK